MIKKAVIPAAGLGTRLLPATKAQPKEMLPLVDKPAIQYVVEEAIDSGIEDLMIITGRGKRALEDHFDTSYELESFLEQQGKYDLLKEIQKISNIIDLHYIRQGEPLGLGHAISRSKRHIGQEPFAVLLGDDIYVCDIPAIQQLINIFNEKKATLIAVQRVKEESIGLYGVIDYEMDGDNVYKIKDLVEKPKPEDAPSDLAIMGRYILSPTIFDCIEKTKPDKNGEIQLTDALKILVENEPVYAVEIDGCRYDIGSKIDYLITTVKLALAREDLGVDFKKKLKEMLD